MRRLIAAGAFYGPPRHNNKQKKRKKYSIVVVRLTRAGQICNSRPCDSCITKLRELGIDKIYYSCEGGILKFEKVKSMTYGHLSSGKQYLRRGCIDRSLKK